jgi:hypothetical protein
MRSWRKQRSFSEIFWKCRQRIEDNVFRPYKGQRVVQRWIGFSEDDEFTSRRVARRRYGRGAGLGRGLG